MFFLFAVFSNKPKVFLPKYSQMAILHASQFRRVVNSVFTGVFICRSDMATIKKLIVSCAVSVNHNGHKIFFFVFFLFLPLYKNDVENTEGKENLGEEMYLVGTQLETKLSLRVNSLSQRKLTFSQGNIVHPAHRFHDLKNNSIALFTNTHISAHNQIIK